SLSFRYCRRTPPPLHSFPTRRSSDLCPLCVVLVSYLMATNYYREFASFWLRVDNYVFLTFVGPIIALVLASLVFILFSCILTRRDRKSTRLNSSHVKISYAVFCLKKK